MLPLNVWKSSADPPTNPCQLSIYLRLAERDEIVITRHGRPAGVLIGFASEDDWFEYRLQKDPRFLARIDKARKSLRAGRGKRLDDVEE